MDSSGEARPGPALAPLRRDLDIFPIEQEGKPLFVLQDQEGLSSRAIAVSPGAMAIVSLLDGRNTAADLQALIAKETGVSVTLAQIERLVSQLEESDLLETERVREKRRRMLEEFLVNPVRPAVLKGAYPQDQLELAGFLGSFFRDAKGPGKPLSEKPLKGAPPRGLIAPHIDLRRGGPAYAWAYGALAESEPPDLIVALGVAHSSPNSPWVMTKKAYETPYGPMTVDEEAYGEIGGRLWYDPLMDEWSHRREHSLEFQALWLKFLWREKTPPWVPILCSSFERFTADRAPSSVATVEKAIREIGEVLAGLGRRRRIMILAGVDLAHVGPRFGDGLELGPELEKKMEAEDRGSLERAMSLDADGFYLAGVGGGSWRKVCGLSALYTSLRWIKALGGESPSSGRLLTYGQAPDPSGGIVSFAGGVFF